MRVQRRAEGRHILAHCGNQRAVRDNGSAHDIPVTRSEFGEAVQENIDVVAAMVVKSGKGVIHDGEAFSAARVPRQMLDVRDFRHGIGGAFEHHQASRRIAKYAFDADQILDGQQRVPHPIFGQQVLHDVARWPIGLDEAQNMVALLTQ